MFQLDNLQRLVPALSRRRQAGSGVAKDRETRVLVWDSRRLAYLRVPKAANTSIRRTLPDFTQHRVDIRRLEELFPGYLTFSFVRNPWARLLSTFNEKLRLDRRTDKHFLNGVHRDFIEREYGFEVGMPFEKFAEFACSLDDATAEKHLCSQSFFLVRDGKVIPEFLGRVETMSEDWARLAGRASISETIGHHNRQAHAHYTAYYDSARIRNLVGDRYREDIETFGYDFGE